MNYKRREPIQQNIESTQIRITNKRKQVNPFWIYTQKAQEATKKKEQI